MSDTAALPLLDGSETDRLRATLDEHFTVDVVNATLDWEGQAALARGDFSGAARVLSDDPASQLIRLFLLADPVSTAALERAIGRANVDALDRAGIVEVASGSARARLELRPYAESDPGRAAADAGWWVLSDFGSDIRPGPLSGDHVLGIGAAALLLAQSTMRRPVKRALDIGTGCGIQSLHLSRHSQQVTATDISRRALRFAATSAALAGVTFDLREGSLLEPVAGEAFDLIVSNPPFVISPGWNDASGGYTYRDGGLPGDELCRRLVRGLANLLSEGGTAQLLANWAITTSEPASERLLSWLPGGVDAWIWQREVADPGEYVALWLRDGGEVPGTERWRRRYDAWRDWFAEAGILAIGMGLISLRRGGTTTGGTTSGTTSGTTTSSAASGDIIVFEDVAQPVEQPIGGEIAAWFERADWLAARSDADLMQSCLRVSPDVTLRRDSGRAPATGGSDMAGEPNGWRTSALTLVQNSGMRWQLETDETIASVLAGCDGATPLSLPAVLLADTHGLSYPVVAESLAPIVRDLIARGLLLPGDAS
ncbi:methyltransferase family protein [Jatrophihabitans sp. GAS493]|uniref:DUF7782 domain-containing protein n=1 Tax=Jatrophihabitans sp. GAS493 TaxID=1907575 RepID=UPI000BC08E6F|nr:methyltransferase [Jatrophihabitans sp. GAS493]SOD74099.1 methyltransferase family protein [Jatrophihabitans sp. GAS493]